MQVFFNKWGIGESGLIFIYFPPKSKPFIQYLCFNEYMKKEYIVIIIILLVGILSFGLGRMSALEQGRNDSEVEFIVPSLSKIDMNFKSFGYVASINGTKYYPRGCKAVNRIKVTNRIYFKSREDAKKSGYDYTSSC